MDVQKLNKPLKYRGYAIVCQEVPDEISLAFNISGCPYHCKDCHSQYLWDYKGDYLGQDIDNILSQIKDLITCVCFMGGDQNLSELFDLCQFVKTKYELKTCIYSGLDDIDIFIPIIRSGSLDYLKIGRYIKERGPLNSVNTNQVMYRNDYINGKWRLKDITNVFQQKYKKE